MSFLFDEPHILFSESQWMEFMPTGIMTVPQALNATVRFTVYFSLLLFIATRNPLYIFLIPVVMVSTLIAHILFPRVKAMTIEGFVSGHRGTEVVAPTQENPFMNPTLVDIHERPNKPPADDITKKSVRDAVNAEFVKTSDLLMDHGDPYQVVGSQLNFHSVATDDHGGFLTFLKGKGTTDKSLNDGYVAAKGTLDERLAVARRLPSAAPAGSTDGFPYA